MKTTDIKWNRSQDGIVESKCGIYRIERWIDSRTQKPARRDGCAVWHLFVLDPGGEWELVVTQVWYARVDTNPERLAGKTKRRHGVAYSSQGGAKRAAFWHLNAYAAEYYGGSKNLTFLPLGTGDQA